MNFRQHTPFLLFAAAFLACLLAQADQSQEDALSCLQEQPYVVTLSDELHSHAQQMLETSSTSTPSKFVSSHEAQDYTSQQFNGIHSLHGQAYPQTNCQRRLLSSSVSTNNKFILFCTLFFQALLLVSRNLILVGVLTNTVEVFLPLVLLGECFLMLGLWTCQKHYLAVLFNGVFNSSWDLFNALRLAVQPHLQGNNLPQLSQYGLSPLIIFNLSGELFVAVLMLVFSVFSRFSAACLRSERMRRMASCLRPVWNGYFMAILPRVVTFTGLHWRLMGADGGWDAVNMGVSGVLSAVIVGYFVGLVVQLRRANANVEAVEEAAASVGLTRRIDLRRDFEFDCLRFGSLYYPCLTYLRVVFYCLLIGLCWDYYYLSYGAPITAQLGILMAEVSSSGYRLRRDRILFPLQNFTLLIIHLTIITVALAESVQHSEVSEVAETILFSLLIFALGSSFIGVAMDAWAEVRMRCSRKDEGMEREERGEGESAQNFTRQLGKHSTLSEAKRQEDIDEEVSSGDYNVEDAFSIKHSEKPLQLKIKKVRKGKVI